MTLGRIREEIDAVDDRILELLERRFGLALLARRRKTATRDPAREAALLARLAAKAGPCLDAAFIESLYGAIMAESRALQDRAPELVGYSFPGPESARRAIRGWKPGAAAIGFGSPEELIEALADGGVDRAALEAGAIPGDERLAALGLARDTDLVPASGEPLAILRRSRP